MRKYTQEQVAWLCDNYPRMTNRELAEAFNERWSEPSVTSDAMHNFGSSRRLRKTRETLRRRNVKYTPEMLDFVRGFAPGHTEREVADAFERRFGMRLTVPMVRNLKHKLGVKGGVNGGRFRKGHTSHNKGRSWDEYLSEESQRRCRATTFRKGNVSGIAADIERPLLDVREGRDGYLFIKVAPRNKRHSMRNWIPLAKFEWMVHNGREFPEGHHCVFADKDKRNFDPNNLVAVPDDLYAIITGGAHGHGVEYHDRETLEVAITHAKLIRRRRRLEMRERECGCCGEAYMPEYPHQRTCRACLDAGRRAPRVRHT